MNFTKLIIFTAAIIILVALLNWSGFLLGAKNLLSFSKDEEETSLRLQNQALRSELERTSKNNQNNFKPDYLSAKVYSTYPFNAKNTLTISVGSDDGVEPHMAVVSEGVFIGRIADVQKKYSTIQTIFDSNWELPVRVGEKEVDALLVPGVKPKISLITKDSKVVDGQNVSTAGADFPYGLVVGTVSHLRQAPGESFLSGDLNLVYNLGDLRIVQVIKNYAHTPSH